MQLSDFLHHQPPMILLDDLLDAGEDYAIAKVKVSREMLFATDAGLPTWTAIEIMAQTISLYSGLKWVKKGMSPKMGFLLGTKKIHFDIPYFALGTELLISVKKKYRHKSIWYFDCELKYLDSKIATVLNVYEPIDEE